MNLENHVSKTVTSAAKKVASIALILLATSAFITNVAAQEVKVKWAEWSTFHGVMSETFHPSEEGNFEPIRTRSEEMIAKAEAWQKSTPPKEFDKPNVKELLVQLVKDSKELDAMVKKKASDAALKKALESLHDLFHSIVGACRNEEEHKEHNEHDGHKH